ncbi:MAG: ABC transporter permease subunit, partial [Silvanigrellaceae bacterium]|nr:ABC transporter permease subunit [Silvanigrellaceae bacterium]
MSLLWTDQCFLGMLLLSLFLILRSLKKAHVKHEFQRLFQQPLAVCSGIVLLFFLIIGTLDSIHFMSSVKENNSETIHKERISVLDKLVAPLGQTYEKTYSAPLALTLYSTETSWINGKIEQIYARLLYPPTTLTDANKYTLIKKILIWTLAVSSLVVLALLGLYCLLSRQKNRWSLCVGAAFLSVFFCLFFVIASYWLSRYFHLFGTGKIGEDIFYYTIKSIRTGLIIGTLTTVLTLPLAIVLGLSAGYFNGVVDDIIQYIYITLSSIPGVLLITASVLSMQTYIANHPLQFSTLEQSSDARLFMLCIILGVTSWTNLCRLLRAEALKFNNIDFVVAAKALGTGSFRILHKHLLPNVMPIILITVVL